MSALRFSANLSMLFQELPFLDRFQAAADAGFRGVECWFPYEHGVDEIAERLSDLDLTMVGINTPHGAAHEWGLAALPGREDAFLDGVDLALEAATRFGRCAVHVMGGLVGSVPWLDAQATYASNLRRAVERAEGSGIQLLVEPLNRRDRPGYVLHSVEQAVDLLERRGLETLRIMFDCYHVQTEEGDLVRRLRRHISKIGHVQIAEPPDRSEPGTGEIDYGIVFSELRRLQWPGWIGLEYRPSTTTLESLHWLRTLESVST